MKRILALLLTLCMLFIVCGCDSSGNSSQNGSSKNNSSVESDNTVSADESQVDDNVSNNGSKKGKGSVNMSGDSSDSFIVIDDEEDENANQVQVVESGTAVSTLATPWDKVTVSHPAGNTDAAADKLRNAILNSTSNYNISGTTYYFSPKGDDNNDGKSPAKAKKTTVALAAMSLREGDAVLFERGGVWRLSRAIKCAAGVTYGAYGSGEKPAFYGSIYNYADPIFWTATNLKNVWSVSVSDTDIGLLVINHGEIVGRKTKNGLLDLSKNGDFYFNRAHSILYLYYDGGNPGKKCKDIELCLNKAAFDVNRVSDVTIDNVKVKYFARLGIDLAAADNSKVTNCEVGFIGGAYQNSNTRLGNAIQMWQGCDGHLVENCWTYQIYDTGVTFQGDSLNPITRAKRGTHEEDYLNITYRNNLIEYCALSIELWHGNHNSADNRSWEYTDAVFKNIHIENNISRFAGYGWSSLPGQRPDPHGEHIIMYAHAYPYARDVYIENNLFDICDAWICRWQFNLEYKEDTNDATRKKVDGVVVPIDNAHKNGIWTIRNNTYYHAKNKAGGLIWYGGQKTGSGQAALENALKNFDSSPAKVVWITG